MKVTRHICDFNTNLPQHEAHVQIIIDQEGGDRRRDLDACGKHLASMIQSMFITNANAKTLFVSKLVRGEIAVPQNKKAGITYEKKPCPAGCGGEFSPQGMVGHLAVKHPDYARENGIVSKLHADREVTSDR